MGLIIFLIPCVIFVLAWLCRLPPSGKDVGIHFSEPGESAFTCTCACRRMPLASALGPGLVRKPTLQPYASEIESMRVIFSAPPSQSQDPNYTFV